MKLKKNSIAMIPRAIILEVVKTKKNLLTAKEIAAKEITAKEITQ